MATQSKAAPKPQIIITVVDGVAQVTIQHWHQPNKVLFGIEHKIDKALHLWRTDHMRGDEEMQQRTKAA